MGLRPPRWWYGEGRGLAAALTPLGHLYGRLAERRAARIRPYVSHLPVVCIGNFTVGGGGKTPTAIAVAEILKLAGERPAFLTRGYGGKVRGPARVTQDMDAAQIGDEPLLLAQHAPTVVAADRGKGAQVIETMDASVIVMDDGFQNPGIAKDLSLIAVDAKVGIGNGLVLPAGPLRAPLEPQIEKADALILIGDGNKASALCRRFAASGKLVLKARLQPTQDTRWLSVLPVVAFAGVARPEKFFSTLRQHGARIEETKVFPDHHRYSNGQASALLALAQARKCMLVTTEKDWVRLPDDRDTPAGELKFRSRPLPVVLRVGDEAALGDLLMPALARKRGG
jgi:tetraacyldisaccharide 4'-kinase